MARCAALLLLAALLACGGSKTSPGGKTVLMGDGAFDQDEQASRTDGEIPPEKSARVPKAPETDESEAKDTEEKATEKDGQPEADKDVEAAEAEARAKERRRSDVLLTTGDEIEAGRQGAKAVEAQMGVLDNAALDAYVTEVGNRLLRAVPRRGFEYEFSVVDQTEPNAFALPGGQIYVSRGLLAMMNNEDELACVLGHEITHSHRRHAARQQAIVAHQSRFASGFIKAQTMAGYGRDMEREADEGGQKIAAAVGYDPMGMSTFLESLEQYERMRRGYSRSPGWFDSHPTSRERASVNAFRAREIRWQRDPALGDTHVGYLERVAGLPVGPRPESGFFRGSRFVHPVLGFQVSFPDSWQTLNTNQAVGAFSPKGDAQVFLAADQQPGDPEEMANRFVAELAREGADFEVLESRGLKVAGLPAWRILIEIRVRGGKLQSYITTFAYREIGWRLMAVTMERLMSRYRSVFLNVPRSFRGLRPEDSRGLKFQLLRLIETSYGDTVTTIGQRTDNGWSATETAVWNGVRPSHRFGGGELVKIAQEEAWRPPAR